MVFSLICALVFWLVIDISENPSRDVTITDIPLNISEQSDDNNNVLLPIGDYTQKVSAIVSGPGYIVSTVSKDDIKVSVSSYADVTKPGTYLLSLTASVEINGCTVTKINPSYIQVEYDYDKAADIPVEVDTEEFQKFIVGDCEIYKSSLKNNADGVEIEKLHVTGPSATVSSIAKVIAKPILPSEVLSETQNFNNEIYFYDAQGNVLESTELVYNVDTYVRIVVYKTADVNLLPTFSNLPKCFTSTETGMPDYSLSVLGNASGRREQINKVKIKGPVDTVNELMNKGLQLSPIDFLSVSPDNTSFNVSFLLPDGVEIVDGTEEVTVALDVGRLTTKTLYFSPSLIEFSNLNSSLKASSSYKRNIKVVLCGRSTVLNNLSTKNVKLMLDCTDIIGPTIETRKITVDIPTEYIAWLNVLEPQEISIVIE